MKFISALIEQHLERYDKLAISDIYKLLHQAALGSSHATDSKENILASLEKEVSTLKDGAEEPLVDPISPDGKLARIHLRPYTASNYSLSALSDAFHKTANEHQGSLHKLEKFCACFVELSVTGYAQLSHRDVAAFIEKIKIDSYPTVRHSETFRLASQPAYRIIHLDFLKLG